MQPREETQDRHPRKASPSPVEAKLKVTLLIGSALLVALAILAWIGSPYLRHPQQEVPNYPPRHTEQ